MKVFVNISLGAGEQDHALTVVDANGEVLADLNGIKGACVLDVKNADRIVLDGEAMLQALDEAKAATATAIDEKGVIAGELDAANASVADLQGKLGTANASVVDLQAKLGAATASEADLQAKLDAANAQVADLTAQLAAATAPAPA